MIIKTNTKGYNYKYTDLAGIQETLDELGISYQQETRTEPNGKDYVFTRIIQKDGKINDWSRGAEIIRATLQGKSNPAQEYGSALTYARRYSLMMTLGIATTDDDAESLTNKEKRPDPITPKQNETILDLIAKCNLTEKLKEILETNYKVSNMGELTNEQAKNFISRLEKTLKGESK